MNPLPSPSAQRRPLPMICACFALHRPVPLEPTDLQSFSAAKLLRVESVER